MTRTSRLRQAILGVAFLCVLLSLSGLAVALYSGAFTRTIPVTLKAARAGLLMDPGSDVKLRGVVVGTVGAVEYRDGSAVISLELQPDQMRSLPSNVGATVEPTTVFGRRFVSLVLPPHPAVQRLSAGAVIDSGTVPVEVNDVFANLVSVLDVLQPGKLNATLGAVSQALDGRGAKLGGFLDKLNTYLGDFNESIPQLAEDLPKLNENVRTLSSVAPDLVKLLDNASTTSASLVDKQAGLNAFLLSFTKLGNDGNTLFAGSEVPLVRALDVLDPTTRLLAEYSPMYPCFFAGLNQTGHFLERTIGGTKPGVNGIATFLPGQQAYQSPRDLPIDGASAAPNCYGMPRKDSDPPQPHYVFNDGSHPYEGGTDDVTVGNPPLALLLFGSSGESGK